MCGILPTFFTIISVLQLTYHSVLCMTVARVMYIQQLDNEHVLYYIQRDRALTYMKLYIHYHYNGNWHIITDNYCTHIHVHMMGNIYAKLHVNRLGTM